MAEVEIKNFPELLRGHIDPNKTIKNLEMIKLPQAGYGSVMAKVTITLQDETGTEDKLYVVAKLLPTDPFVKKVFQIEFTYKNEVAFYSTIVPTLLDFQEEQGVFQPLSMFAEFYGARLSLDKDEVDENAVLLLKDLSVAGYKNANRQTGFDLEATKLILKDLAIFQGTAIALKLKKPQLFEEKVKGFCRDFVFDEGVVFTDQIKTILKENESCAHLADKIGHWPCEVPLAREPYATVAHGDLWVNNTMQKLVEGKVQGNVFVDFQVYSYRSCASDVFFFLWTSCQKDILENHLDDLLKYYHDNLIETIKEFNFDMSKFSYEKFLDDIKYESTYEFGHALTFVIIVKDKPMLDEENLKKNMSKEEAMAQLPQRVKDFLFFMVQECDKRGWLH